MPVVPFIPAIIGAAGAIGGAVLSSNASSKASSAANAAMQGAQSIANNLTYQPVNIEKIKQDAANQAVTNATASLNLERSLQPDVAAARSGVSKTINEQLALGGKLPPDIANQVAQAARVSGGMAGGYGGTPGVTASLLGTTALNLLNSRVANAEGLLASNPLPTAGLDPGSVASAEIGNTNAQNQFNAAKAGIQTNLLNSQGQFSAAQAGATAGTQNSYLNLLTSLVPKFAGAFTGSSPTSPTATPAPQTGIF